jgi:hypothetical protein
MIYYKSGKVTGTGAALPVPVGFAPSRVRLVNKTRGTEIIWTPDFVDGEGIKFGGTTLLSDPGLAIGSTPANLASGAFSFSINGMSYTKAAVAAGTALTATVVPQNKYGAFGLQIPSGGTLAVIDAAANATGYASAALALAAWKAVAPTAANVVLGCVIVICTSGTFTGATTSLAAAGVTATYVPYGANRPVGLISVYNGSIGSAAVGFSIGTDVDINTSGDTILWEAFAE